MCELRSCPFCGSQRISQLHEEIQRYKQRNAELDEHLKQKDLIIYRQAARIMELEENVL